MTRDSYRDRKALRKQEYQKMTGPKKVCAACSGSGKYDNNGSPKCGACNGTGKTRL